MGQMVAINELAELLRTMRPTLNEGVYVFTSVPPGTDYSSLAPLATFREAEGVTLIVEENVARQAGLPSSFRGAWITLLVHSDLYAVGLTAAVAAALARADISCNVVASTFHDHLFVPHDAAHRAIAVLEELQQRSSPR